MTGWRKALKLRYAPEKKTVCPESRVAPTDTYIPGPSHVYEPECRKGRSVLYVQPSRAV